MKLIELDPEEKLVGVARTTSEAEGKDDGNGDDEADGASEDNGIVEEKLYYYIKYSVFNYHRANQESLCASYTLSYCLIENVTGRRIDKVVCWNWP